MEHKSDYSQQLGPAFSEFGEFCCDSPMQNLIPNQNNFPTHNLNPLVHRVRKSDSASLGSCSESDSIHVPSWRSIDLFSVQHSAPSDLNPEFDFSPAEAKDLWSKRGVCWITDASSCCSSMCSSASTVVSASFSAAAPLPSACDFGPPPLFSAGFGDGLERKRRRLDAPAHPAPADGQEEFSLGHGDPDAGRCGRR